LRPSWSPLGGLIAFTSDRGGNTDIWVIPAAGGTPEQQTTHPGPDWDSTWSPDGSQVAFTSTRGGNEDIWVVDVLMISVELTTWGRVKTVFR
jgi:Tol biopolymer transport system component